MKAMKAHELVERKVDAEVEELMQAQDARMAGAGLMHGWLMVGMVVLAVVMLAGMSGCATVCEVADGVGPAPVVQEVVCGAVVGRGQDGAWRRGQ